MAASMAGSCAITVAVVSGSIMRNGVAMLGDLHAAPRGFVHKQARWRPPLHDDLHPVQPSLVMPPPPSSPFPLFPFSLCPFPSSPLSSADLGHEAPAVLPAQKQRLSRDLRDPALDRNSASDPVHNDAETAKVPDEEVEPAAINQVKAMYGQNHLVWWAVGDRKFKAWPGLMLRYG